MYIEKMFLALWYVPVCVPRPVSTVLVDETNRDAGPLQYNGEIDT